MTTNPRGRNQLEQSAFVRAPAQLPALEVLRSADPAALQVWSQAVKETLDVRHGRGRDPFEAWVTRRDLHTYGLIGGRTYNEIPPDHMGFATWTSRGRFEVLSLTGLAAALKDVEPFRSQTAGTVADLQTSIQELAARITNEAGVSQNDVSAQLQALTATLERRWAADIALAVQQATQALDARISAAEARAATADARALRARGYVHEQSVAGAVWTIEHNLQRRPVVTVFNSADEKIEADVAVVDENTVTITHSSAITGWAVFR